jgi:hypothetical protein
MTANRQRAIRRLAREAEIMRGYLLRVDPLKKAIIWHERAPDNNHFDVRVEEYSSEEGRTKQISASRALTEEEARLSARVAAEEYIRSHCRIINRGYNGDARYELVEKV